MSQMATLSAKIASSASLAAVLYYPNAVETA